MDDHTELKRLRWELAGWTKHQAAELLGVSLNHYQKWESGRSPVPAYVIKMIEVYACGFLPGAPGWRWINGQLVAPNNDVFTPGQIMTITLLYAQISELKYQLKKHRPPVVVDAQEETQFPVLRRS